jgi:hypothetical protein
MKLCLKWGFFFQCGENGWDNVSSKDSLWIFIQKILNHNIQILKSLPSKDIVFVTRSHHIYAWKALPFSKKPVL